MCSVCENGGTDKSEVRGRLDAAWSSGIWMTEGSRGGRGHCWPEALWAASGSQRAAVHLLFWCLVLRKLKLPSWEALLKIGFSIGHLVLAY